MPSTVRSRWMDGIRPGGDVRQDGPNCWAVRQLLGRAQAGERSRIRCWTGSAARELAELSQCKRAKQLAAEPSVRAKLGRKTGRSRRGATEPSRANASLGILHSKACCGSFFLCWAKVRLCTVTKFKFYFQENALIVCLSLFNSNQRENCFREQASMMLLSLKF